jgi:hypothetical protein
MRSRAFFVVIAGLGGWLAGGCAELLGLGEVGDGMGGGSSVVTASSNGSAGATGTTTGTGGAGGSASSSSSGSGDGGCNRSLTVVHSAGVSSGYPLVLQLPHAALVAAGKSDPSGNDVRVEMDVNGVWTPLHRVAEPADAWGESVVTVVFRTPNLLANDARYRVRYGVAGGQPLANPAMVYDVWDPFDGATVDASWTETSIGAGVAVASAASMELVVSGRGDALTLAPNDSMGFVSRSYDGDFQARMLVTLVNNENTAALVGGLMVRDDLTTDAAFGLLSFRASGTGQSYAGWRLAAGADSQSSPQAYAANLPLYVRLRRKGNNVIGEIAPDARDYTEKLSQSIALSDPVRVGFPLFNNEASMLYSYFVDWFSLRMLVDPEPLVQLSGVENCP